MAYIYKITNDVNGKAYVGKTEFDIHKRFREHCHDAFRERCEKRPLYSAMRKYGIEHFHVELVEETDAPEEREEYWIGQFNTYHYGYNATVGGDGKKYLDHSHIVDTYNQVLNLRATAERLGIHEKTVSQILRKYGVQAKSSSAILKERLSKEVLMTNKETGESKKFESVMAVATYLFNNGLASAKKPNDISSHIANACSGKRKSAYGHTFKYL